MSLPSSAPCPCGLGPSYGGCCGRLHAGQATAATAEALMRSRYSAFALRDEAYLLRTWHASTRPARLRTDPDTHWTGLEIVATAGGGALLPRGTVEFRASYRQRGAAGEAGVQRGNSRFVREDGQWYYLDEDPAG